MEEYSVFKCKRFHEKKEQWEEEYLFYKGNCLGIYTTTDWRFCEVPGKRTLLEYIGKGLLEFPIEFPVELDNGIILN